MEQAQVQKQQGSMFEGVTWYHWLIVVIASCGWLFDCMDQRIFVLAREASLTSLLGPDEASEVVNFFGTVATTCLIFGWATGGIIFGIISDKYGRVKTMVFTLLVYSGFTGLSALAVSWADFCIYRFLVGLGVGGMFGAATTLVAESVPGKVRSLALGTLQTLSAMGNVLGSFIALKIKPSLDFNIFGWEIPGWRAIFLVGILPALLIIPIIFILREPESWRHAKEQAKRGELDEITKKKQQMGSLPDLFRKQPWRTHTIVGLCLGLSGMVGLWGIGFFSPELITRALSDKPLTVEDIEDPSGMVVKFKEESDPISRYLKQRFSKEAQEQIDSFTPEYWYLSVDEVTDWDRFVERLNGVSGEGGYTPADRLWEFLPQNVQEIILTGDINESQKETIVETINNQILRDESYFDIQYFMYVELPSKFKNAVYDNDIELTDNQILVLNRRLVEAAAPKAIADSFKPLRELFKNEINEHLYSNLFYQYGYYNLFEKILAGEEAVYVYLKNKLAPETRQMIESYDSSTPPTPEQQELMAKDLIRILDEAEKKAANKDLIAFLALSKGVRNLVERDIQKKEGEEYKEVMAITNRQLLEDLYPDEIRHIKEYVGDVRAKGTMLQDVGSFLGMFAFTLVATFLGRKLAFFIAFVLCMVITMFVFYTLDSAMDAYWMLPLMGFAQLSLFGGYSIYFPELFPTRLRGTGVGFCYNTVRYLAAPFPILLGYLTILLSFRMAAVLMALIYVVGIVALIWAPETKGRELPEEQDIK